MEGHRFSISKYRDEGCVRQVMMIIIMMIMMCPTDQSAAIQEERRARDLLACEGFLCGWQGVCGEFETSSFQPSCQGGQPEFDSSDG